MAVHENTSLRYLNPPTWESRLGVGSFFAANPNGAASCPFSIQPRSRSSRMRLSNSIPFACRDRLGSCPLAACGRVRMMGWVRVFSVRSDAGDGCAQPWVTGSGSTVSSRCARGRVVVAVSAVDVEGVCCDDGFAPASHLANQWSRGRGVADGRSCLHRWHVHVRRPVYGIRGAAERCDRSARTAICEGRRVC